jgi:hypothetical protein
MTRELLDEEMDREATGVAEPPFLPIAHHLHPDDPTERTALCGAEILGIPSFGEHLVCEKCLAFLEVNDRYREEKPLPDIVQSPRGDGRWLLVVNHPVARAWIEERLVDCERDGDGWVLERDALASIIGELYEAFMP